MAHEAVKGSGVVSRPRAFEGEGSGGIHRPRTFLVRRAMLLTLVVGLIGMMAYSMFVVRPLAFAASTAAIDGATKFQTIDGFGFSEAFGQASNVENAPASQQQQALNDLFSTSTGAGFTILRNLLPSDSGNTIEPNNPGSPNASPSYAPLGSSEGQVWMAQQAKNYGVTQLYGDAWSAPGYMKTNGNEANGGVICGTPGASCSSGDWRQAYANYLTQYAKDYASAGVPLTEIGAFNEPDFTASYSSMNMTAAQTADMIRYLKPTLAAAGLNPKVVCCDPTGWGQAQNYTSGVTSNSSASANVDMFSSHGYSGAPTSPLNGVGSRHVWETEWSTFEGQDNAWDDGTAASGFTWAQHIHTGLTSANLNAFLYWWGAVGSGTTDNEGVLQLASNGTVVPAARLWALANYSRFIRPGATRIGATTTASGLDLTAFINTDGSVIVVALNTASSDSAVSFGLQNVNVANGASVTPYLTNGSNGTAAQSALSVSNGAFSATVPARSLVTYRISGSSGGVTPTPTSVSTPTPMPTVTPIPTPTATATPPASGVHVSYQVVNQWSGGFTANMTITNNGASAINGWTLQFTFPGTQQVTQLWDGQVTQSGEQVTVKNMSYNATIAPGGVVSLGFNGSWSGSNPSPASFTLNGTPTS